jgi:periplasmic protein TonB
MPVLPPRDILPRRSKQDSWLARVRENFQQLLMPMKFSSLAPNSVPLLLVDLSRGYRGGRAQVYSLLTHAIVIAILFCLAAGIHIETMPGPALIVSGKTILRYVPPSVAGLIGEPSPGRKGGGGNENAIPATRGNLALRSSLQLLAPHLPQNEKPELPVPVTIFDAEAPPFTSSVTHLGLPWMPSDTHSGGPGKNHGVGEGPGNGMGDEEGNGEGFGADGRPYANLVSWPVCTYCPDPSYTEEARKGKLQGTVTLRILVTADGRAARVRVVRGLSSDLDERAAQTVKGWRFIPAKDLGRKGVSVWMTVEVLYRLF